MPSGAAAPQRASRLHVPKLSVRSTSLQPSEREAGRTGKAHSDLPNNIFSILEIPVKSHPVPSHNQTWQGKPNTECISSLTWSPKSSSTCLKHFDRLPEMLAWINRPMNTNLQHILYSICLSCGTQVLYLTLGRGGTPKRVKSGRGDGQRKSRRAETSY